MAEVIAALGGAVFLAVFFRAVATRWPQSYVSVSDLVARRVSQSPLRYALFRLGPVVVVAVFISVTIDRIGDRASVAVSLMAIIHAVATSGRGLVNALASRDAFGRSTQIVYHVVIAAGVVLATTVGFALGRLGLVQDLVPPPNELSSSMWTALLAGTFGAFIISVSRGELVEPRKLMEYSKARLGAGLWEYGATAAQRVGADIALVHSIMLTENLARPAWVRRLERVKGVVVKRGSYGVMQVQAESPLSDEESIDLATQRLAGVRLSRGDSHEELQEALRAYNPSPQFIATAGDLYYELRPQQNTTYRSGSDRRSALSAIRGVWRDLTTRG